MNAAKTVVGLIVSLLWASPAAVASDPQAVLDVLPTAEALGPEWKRNIVLLFDPLSRPPEILNTVSTLPESFKNQKRAGVENPNGSVGGWSHGSYSFQTTSGQWQYSVQIERYRNSERLREDFNRLMTLDPGQYHKALVKDLGDAAVFHAEEVTSTIWFRRADFKVWISQGRNCTNWGQDGHLQFLANTLDQRILQGSAGLVPHPALRKP